MSRSTTKKVILKLRNDLLIGTGLIELFYIQARHFSNNSNRELFDQLINIEINQQHRRNKHIQILKGNRGVGYHISHVSAKILGKCAGWITVFLGRKRAIQFDMSLMRQLIDQFEIINQSLPGKVDDLSKLFSDFRREKETQFNCLKSLQKD